ncbi:hypothetical protein HPP92_024938 [Vanilla planifolia]|uniref:CCT domain-containing protein n=1 Tax=Vanilla planifolia TaxID=51239 RepID=A0A835PI53_VANPL|nr:hypothetical protein HPP92_024938 [Vanilla planifolia]
MQRTRRATYAARHWRSSTVVLTPQGFAFPATAKSTRPTRSPPSITALFSANSARPPPAAIYCPSCSQPLALCSNCDFDAHKAGGNRHDRRTVEPFSGCPTAADLPMHLASERRKGRSPGGGGRLGVGCTTGFSWDDLILPSTTTPFHGFQAMGIPPPPKDRNLYCGKLKEEIHRQIRDLRKAEHDGINYIDEVEPITEFSSMPLESFHREKLYSKHDYNPIFVAPPSSELSNMQSKQRDHQEALSSPINISLVDCTIEAASSANLPGATEKDPNNPNSCGNLTSVPRRDALGVFDRSSVLSRYKEKRKTRRYDKLIRYESRKARADNRVRIKGRFAKVGQI